MQRVFVEATTIGDLVDRAAAESDGDAIVFPDERVTFPELAALTDRFARSLRGLGVGPRRQGRDPDAQPARLRGGLPRRGQARRSSGAGQRPLQGARAEPRDRACRHLGAALRRAGRRTRSTFPSLLARVFPDAAGRSRGRFELESAPLLRALVHLNGERPGFLTAYGVRCCGAARRRGRDQSAAVARARSATSRC